MESIRSPFIPLVGNTNRYGRNVPASFHFDYLDIKGLLFGMGFVPKIAFLQFAHNAPKKVYIVAVAKLVKSYYLPLVPA